MNLKFLLTAGCLLVLTLTVWSQRTITGQIVEKNKEPIIGAAILEKGTSNGTTTDVEGNFSLAVASDSSVLVVSYIGLKTQEIKVGDQSVISVTMEDDTKDLEEVVIIGYGSVKKSDLTGAVTTLKPADVKQVPTGNVLDAIQGKAAGVDITRASGETGKAPDIVIRGNRSITAANGPLYIVDGVQYSSIQDINPNDIQSMEVLKDASSTAIYGSRGANGVIIITTKRGAAGDIKVSINSYYGVSSVSKWGFSGNGAYPLANDAEAYAQIKRENYRTSRKDVYGTDLQALGSDYANYQNGVQNDYTKDLLHKGVQKNLQIGIAGGTEKIKSYFSLDYYEEKGLLKNDVLKRYTGRLNLDYTVNKYFKVGTQTQVTYYDQNKRANPLGNASKINPLTTPFDANGNIIVRPGGVHANPLIDEQPNTAVDKLTTVRVFPTLYAEITPFKGLSARSNVSISLDNRGEGIYYAQNSYTQLNNGLGYSQSAYDAQNRKQINWQGILNYSTTVKSDHSVGVTALSETILNTKEQFYSQANSQLAPSQIYYNMGEVKTGPIASSYYETKLISFAGRFNYSYKGRYLLTATGRADGASQLAEGKNWDFFPSVAAGWRLSDEQFMSFQKVFSTIKLRASWGVAGNANIRAYSTKNTVSNVPYAYDETPVTAYTYNPQIGNIATKWEKSTTTDIGLDLGIFKERIVVGFDYYNTHTRDLLLTEKLPLTMGAVQTVSNIGKTQNKGVELSISSVNIDKKRFTWSTTLTFMSNRERVVALANGQQNLQITKVDIEDGSQTNQFVVVGSPTTAFFDYEKVGIWQYGQEEEAAKYGQKPGMIHIKDQNGDGKITPEDRIAVGSTVPKWSAGLSSDFKFFNFDVNLYFFARVGNTINYQYAYNPAGTENSLSTREYWTPENPTNDLPRPGYTIESQYAKTINYVDGSFFKLRNATIGYTLPTKLTEKYKISRLRFYVTGKNLFLFNKVKNYDTELNGVLTFPSVRLFVGGVNLEF